MSLLGVRALSNAPARTQPANVDVPIYIDLIRQGGTLRPLRRDHAARTVARGLRQVVQSPCSQGAGATSSTRLWPQELKRFAADFACSLNGSMACREEAGNRKSRRIIGSGPAGLRPHTTWICRDTRSPSTRLAREGGCCRRYSRVQAAQEQLQKDIEVIERLESASRRASVWQRRIHGDP